MKLLISLTISASLGQNVWYPIPKGLDQSQPDSMLGVVSRSARRDASNNRLIFRKAYVFGDSSCDTGNLFKLNGFQDPRPDIYWRGRLSNGPGWPDYLSAQYGLAITNYAFGGATISNENFVNVGKDMHFNPFNPFWFVAGIPDFSDQISIYLDNRTQSDPRPLGLVQFVGNDLINKQVTAEKAAGNMAGMIQWLIDIGEIKDFLIFQSPIKDYDNLGYNKALSAIAKKLTRDNPGTLVHAITLMPAYIDMVLTPPPTSTKANWQTSACYNQNNGSLCADPQNHFLFDLYHPSTIPNYNTAQIIGRSINYLWRK